MSLVRRNATTIPEPYVVPPTNRFDGNDGSWSTFMINVGQPGQNFRIIPSTSGSTTWVPIAEGCSSNDPDDCPDRRGVELFGGAKSQGYDAPESSSSKFLGLYGMQLGSTDIDTSYGKRFDNHSARYEYDTVGLGPASDQSLQFDPEVVAGVVDKAFFLGGFGLSLSPNNFGAGALPTFLSLMPNSTFRPIPSLSYGYTAGASYQDNHVGSLMIGGYDKSRFIAPPTSFAMSTNNSLNLAVQSITVDIDGNTYSATLDENNFAHTFTASIDSTLPYLWLPGVVCDRLEQIFSLTYDKDTGLYLVNSTSLSQNLNSKLSIKLAESQTSNTFTVITLPYAAFNLNASWPIYQEDTAYFPIRRAPNDVFTLGRTLLQETYLTVDYQRNNFSIAQAAFDNKAPQIIAIQQPANPTSNLSKDGLIGIIIGATVLIVLITILCFFCLIRRRKRRDVPFLKSNNSRQETSDIPQAGNWTFQPSDNGSYENQPHAGILADRDVLAVSSEGYYSAASNLDRQQTLSPTFSPMTLSSSSSVREWPLPNNYEMPANEIRPPQGRQTSSTSELPGLTESQSSSNRSTENSSRSNETSYGCILLENRYSLEKPERVHSTISEMSCDTEIHELESPITSPRVSGAPLYAERYRNLLTPPPEEGDVTKNEHDRGYDWANKEIEL